MARSEWANVEVKARDKNVYVSFNRDDEVAITTIARWFGLSVKDFKKLIPPKGEGNG